MSSRWIFFITLNRSLYISLHEVLIEGNLKGLSYPVNLNTLKYKRKNVKRLTNI